MNLDTFVAQVLTYVLLLPMTLLMIQHSFYYLKGRGKKLDPPQASADGLRTAIVVPVKGEPEDIVIGMVEWLASVVADEVRGSALFIVSDDDPEKESIMMLKRRAEELGSRLGLETHFVIRDKEEVRRRRGRVGALNYALFDLTRGYDVMLVLDVDSRPEPGYISGLLQCIASGADACVGRWEGYWEERKRTRIAVSTGKVMKFVVDSIYKGRRVLNYLMFPLGSGTAFRRDALLEVGGWDSGIIQDDMHIGAKLLGAGKKIEYFDNKKVLVLVPSTYSALRTQQARWAYGAIEVMVKSLRQLWRAPHSLMKKVEALTFLSQYVPQAIAFFASLFIPLMAVWERIDLMLLHPAYAAFLLAGMGVYGWCIFDSLTRAGVSKVRAVKILGTTSAITVALSPAVMANTLLAALKQSAKYKITPKGAAEKPEEGINVLRRMWVEFLYAVIMIALTVTNLVMDNVFTAMWAALFAAGLAYVLGVAWRPVRLGADEGINPIKQYVSRG